MMKPLPLALLAGAAMLSGTAAMAAPQTKTVAKSTTTTKTTTPMGGTKIASRTTKTVKGRMVQAKLANGKTATYNCALPGNASKAACK